MGVGGLTVGGSMTLGPTSWQDQSKKTVYPGNGTSKASADSFASDPVEEIVDLARTTSQCWRRRALAGSALDLVLNETVEQAREATRATGAAIALPGDGGMICRATTGNAPNLGTPVDTSSGLSAACLKTGTIQQCSDTEVDPRVDADACRHLDVRSMLLLPISDATGVYRILEVFSPIPNNFGDQDVQALSCWRPESIAPRKRRKRVLRKKRHRTMAARQPIKAMPQSRKGSHLQRRACRPNPDVNWLVPSGEPGMKF